MADVVISVLVQNILERVSASACQTISSLQNTHKEVTKLSHTLSAIRAVLEDAEERQLWESAVRIWLGRLRDVAYDADDVLDDFHAEEDDTPLCFGRFNPRSILSRYKMASRIKYIRERLDEIARDREAFKLEGSRSENVHFGLRQPMQMSSSFIQGTDAFGREKDKNTIVDFLLYEDECNSRKDISMIGVVGMGGIGKTTLAQLAYNDERVVEHFELRMWVCVSEDFNVRRRTKAIVESATRKSPEAGELDPLQVCLEQVLYGRRFLLVLDDVWNEDWREWDVLSAPFHAGAKGSKVIITTRSQRVSSIMGAVPPYNMFSLSDADCWSLFKQCAFVEGISDVNASLEVIGKEIVKKCGGLPLAVKALGGLLRFQTDESAWTRVLNSEIWELPEDGKGIFPALQLSYRHLPAHLKQCFAYCSIFPKDYCFERDELVQLWMAEGFVVPKWRTPLEDIGAEYFDELLSRSFFQYSHKNWEDQSIYKMHDLIQDLAVLISGDMFYRMEDHGSIDISSSCRHSSLLLQGNNLVNFELFYKCKRLRTLLILGGQGTFSPKLGSLPLIPRDVFMKLKFLRALDLSNAFIRELPSSIGSLKHLRYLDLSRGCFQTLPESMSRLGNLQTLKLQNCSKLHELPKGISKLTNLRHIYNHTKVVNSSSKLLSMPPGIGKLANLQILSLFVVGRESGSGIEELKNMNLRGSLCISKLENAQLASEAYLKSKQLLHELELQWSPEHQIHAQAVEAEKILEDLEPPTNLKMLGIFQYNGTRFPSWVGNPVFSNLETIYLFNATKCSALPPLGQLPALKDLYIRGFHGIKKVGTELRGNGNACMFPSLETLELKDMAELGEWSDDAKECDFPHLRELEVVDCPELKELPWLPPTMRNLSIRNCMQLNTLPQLPSLKDLELSGCKEAILKELPFLTSLSSLSLSGFLNLKSLSNGLLNSLVGLKKLYIADLPELKFLPNDEGLKSLTSIERLVISHCPRLRRLPDEGLPASLMYIHISNLDNLQALPGKLHNLSSLQRIEIWHCTQLQSLPDEGLPMSLQNFHIVECSMLSERCQKEMNLISVLSSLSRHQSLEADQHLLFIWNALFDGWNFHEAPRPSSEPWKSLNFKYLHVSNFLKTLEATVISSSPPSLQTQLHLLQRISSPPTEHQQSLVPPMRLLPESRHCLSMRMHWQYGFLLRYFVNVMNDEGLGNRFFIVREHWNLLINRIGNEQRTLVVLIFYNAFRSSISVQI